MENKKYYTTIKTFPCVGNNNSRYTGITAILSLSNIQQREVNGKNMVSARAAINNRTKLINSALGTSFDENEETIWVDVNFWEARADRFLKFVGNREKVLLGVMGTITARQFDRQDGTKGTSLSITADEWFGMNSNSAPRTDAPQYAGAAPSIPAQTDDDLPY